MFTKHVEDPHKLPKALLQQHCQRMGWGGPKYERLQELESGKYRYEITVDVR